MPKQELRLAKIWAGEARDNAAELTAALLEDEPDAEEVAFLCAQIQSAVGKVRSFVEKHDAGETK